MHENINILNFAGRLDLDQNWKVGFLEPLLRKIVVLYTYSDAMKLQDCDVWGLATSWQVATLKYIDSVTSFPVSISSVTN